MVAVGAGGEGDRVVFPVRSRESVLSVHGESRVFGLRVVYLALFLARCAVTGFEAVEKMLRLLKYQMSAEISDKS